MKPMLSKTADHSMVTALAEGSTWAFTQKVDGERRLIVIDDGVIGYGRMGNKTTVPEHLKRAFRRLPAGRFILDGELMEDGVLQLFDAPTISIGGKQFVGLTSPYYERIEVLRTLVRGVWSKDRSIKLLPRATTPGHKLELFEWLREVHAEGIVARRMDAPYLPGKRSPDSLRIKFRQTADTFVLRKGDEGKANLVLAVYGPKGEVVEVGKANARTGDGPQAVVGSVVRVEYQSFSEAGRMISAVNPTLGSWSPIWRATAG